MRFSQFSHGRRFHNIDGRRDRPRRRGRRRPWRRCARWRSTTRTRTRAPPSARATRPHSRRRPVVVVVLASQRVFFENTHTRALLRRRKKRRLRDHAGFACVLEDRVAAHGGGDGRQQPSARVTVEVWRGPGLREARRGLERRERLRSLSLSKKEEEEEGGALVSYRETGTIPPHAGATPLARARRSAPRPR